MSGTGINFVPNSPKCRVPVWRPYRANTGTPGIAVEGIPVPGVQLGGHTELTEVSGTGIVFRPNLTGVFGRVIAAVPNTPLRFGRVFTERIPPALMIGYEHLLRII